MTSRNKKALALPLGMLAAALAFIAVGASRGEAQEIMGKAVRICLECIGIG